MARKILAPEVRCQEQVAGSDHGELSAAANVKTKQLLQETDIDIVRYMIPNISEQRARRNKPSGIGNRQKDKLALP